MLCIRILHVYYTILLQIHLETIFIQNENFENDSQQPIEIFLEIVSKILAESVINVIKVASFNKIS